MHTALPFGRLMSRIAPLLLIALLAAGCGDKDKSSRGTTSGSTATTSTVSTGPSGTTPIPAEPSSKANKLLLGKRDLYPLLSGSLAKYVPNQVTGKSVTIVQKAGIDSFWAGRDEKQRILVKVNLKGNQVPRMSAGRQADFVGHLARATAKDASKLGVKGKTGGPVLQNQGVYVIVSVSDLKLH
jgi:hypothetical protein